VTRPVEIAASALRAWPVLRGIALAVPGTVIVGPGGETLRVRQDGNVDEVLPGGYPRDVNATMSRRAA
jgi:hypothetical protein